MALRAVIDHPKFARLKTLLRLNKAATLGYLEGLWHFCGRYTPQGNIGKYSDADIEAWLEWDGEEGALMAALVKARWVDEDLEHRLLIHDWHRHADDATRMALKRAKQEFAVPTKSEACSDGVATVSRPPVPVPEPVSGAENPPSPPRGKRFVKPTLDEVTDYMVERKIPDAARLAQKFLNHYDANGWRVGGKSPMKDWQAAIRNWEDRPRKPGGLIASRDEMLEAMAEVTGRGNEIVRAGT